MNKQSLFLDYGVGIGLRPPHYQEFLEKPPKDISWVEVISENYIDWKNHFQLSKARAVLQKVRTHIPVALHGVSMSLGSADPLSQDYLKNLKNLADQVEPLWISDHLCWTGVDGENLHDLLPLPYTEEALKHVVKKIKKVQDFLNQRILIENVSSYAEFKHSEMTEWDFLREVAKRADCGILLDVNNVYVSSVNHGFDPLKYLRSIPPERVGQIHVAGHSSQGNILIDTHDTPVCEEVWELLRWTNQNIGLRSTMIERDSDIPAWHILAQEAHKINLLREEPSGGALKAEAFPAPSAERI